MDDIVERIRDLCREQRTSITKLEVSLGFANGTIGKWAKGKRTPPLEKVNAIARELGTTSEYLYTGEPEQKEKPSQTGEPLSEKEYRIMLAYREGSEDTRKAIEAILHVE